MSLPFYAENPSPTDQTGKSSSLLPPDVVYSLRQGPSLSKRRRWRRSFGSRRSLNKKWEDTKHAEATNPTPDTGRRRGRRLRRTESFQLRVQPDLGVVQCRFSEALCVLPFFFPETVWGLFAGCLITNILSPYGLLDLIVGSLATLIAALLTARCRKKWLAPLPPVVLNTLLVGAVIAYEETGLTAAFPATWGHQRPDRRRRRGHRLLWAGDAPAVAAAQDPLFPGSRLPLNRRLCGPSSACLHSAQSGGSIKSIRRESYRSAAGVPRALWSHMGQPPGKRCSSQLHIMSTALDVPCGSWYDDIIWCAMKSADHMKRRSPHG